MNYDILNDSVTDRLKAVKVSLESKYHVIQMSGAFKMTHTIREARKQASMLAGRYIDLILYHEEK